MNIRNIIDSFKEVIESKANNDYKLHPNSPKLLKKNKTLIIQTLKKDPAYLDYIDSDIILDELKQPEFPIGGVLDTAFRSGYKIGINFFEYDSLSEKNAKNAIFAYLRIQKDIMPTDLQDRLETVFERIVKNYNWNEKEKEELIDIAVKCNYIINYYSPQYLKQNSALALNNYKYMLDADGVEKLIDNNIINPSLLQNEDFLKNYITLLIEKNVDKQTIMKSLIHNDDCKNMLKELCFNDIHILQYIFNTIKPVDLNTFFDLLFSQEELYSLLNNNNSEFTGSFARLVRLYNLDPYIISLLNGNLLDKRFEIIPDYKMIIIGKNKKHFQEKILSLDFYRFSLYTRMSEYISKKTKRWNRFEQNIIDNLANGYFDELIKDSYECEKKGITLTDTEIEKLTFLLSKEFTDYMHYVEGLKDVNVEKIKDNCSNNTFNITSKNELGHFDELKEMLCDTILNNPECVDDNTLSDEMKKYLYKFRPLSILDRMKLALLEKYYGINLEEARYLTISFSMDIEKIETDDEYEKNIIEQIKAIKKIYETQDLEALKLIRDLNIFVKTDLSICTFLIEQAKELYAQKYKECLYMPKKDTDGFSFIPYQGKELKVVYPYNYDFSMIVKRVGTKSVKDDNYCSTWNSMTRDEGDLRYYTCTSYMTSENLLHTCDSEIILGFANGCKDYSFDRIEDSDAKSSFYGGDDIYHDDLSSYMLPSTLEKKTNNNYNEIVINTLSIDENGHITKMQPDYIVYIEDSSIDKEKDPLWAASKKAASDFDIPIVFITREKVRNHENSKINDNIKSLNENSSNEECFELAKKIIHYIVRYGINDILSFLSEEKMNILFEKIDSETLEELKMIIKNNKNQLIKEKENEQIENDKSITR